MSDQYYWERPASVPIPTVWEVYESDKPMPNGKIPRFRIQDYTEDWRDDIFHIMMNYFYTEEPLAKCNGKLMRKEKRNKKVMRKTQKMFIRILQI